jgi:hypothetical protein
LSPLIVFAGVMSNMASEIGYVLLIPLAGLIFHSAGRHPIVGMAAAFAGVSGGYSANLLIGTIDPLLAGLSQEAARIVDPAISSVHSLTGISSPPRLPSSRYSVGSSLNALPKNVSPTAIRMHWMVRRSPQ